MEIWLRDSATVAAWNFRRRIDADGTIFFSRWELWNEKEILWNYSRQVAQTLMRARQFGVPESDREHGGRCAVMRKYVIEGGG